MDLPPLSPEAQSLLSDAASESGRKHHSYLGVEHLFCALGRSEATGLSPVLARHGVDAERFGADLMEAAPAPREAAGRNEIQFTPRVRAVLRIAGSVASRAGAPRVEPQHVLEAILQEGRSAPLRRLRAAGIDVAALHEALAAPPPAGSPETPLLGRFGRDLTERARTGALAPVIGREAELEQVTSALLRRQKNNPVLVGEAGVGKTAVVESLARLLAGRDCPEPLRGFRLVELSLPALVAGTRYRGDFEERLTGLVQEAARQPRLILFLDEMHTLIGAGAGEGTMDAANILKPSLARGELRVVGATTVREYRRFIEQDAALERRFEKVLVEEPTAAQANAMLEGIAPALSEFHDVALAPEALAAALELTVRYVPQRRLPDKAIDALDQTCARARLSRSLTGAGAPRIVIGAEDVARTVSQWTGIPVDRLSGEEARRLLHLEEDLRARVVGQDAAVAAVSRAIVTARAGLADPRRPLGVFLFLGPTGVGKTELAKSLAEVVFGDASRMLRFDMSEYGEAHSVAGLIGAPPGYTGSEKEGRLIEPIRTAPHSVVLFDEIEKAHPRIFDLLLPILDEGRLQGASGAPADFRHAILILTSNLAVAPPPAAKHVGFTEAHDPVAAPLDPRSALALVFRPELLNRIDAIVSFRPLERIHLKRILERHVQEIARLAKERDTRLVVDDAVLEWLVAQSDPGRFGARELRRVVDRHLRQPLALAMLEHGAAAATLRAGLEGGSIVFEARA